MAKRKNKKSKRRLAFFGTLSIFVILYFVFNLVYYSYKITVLETAKSDLNHQLVNLQNEEKDLSVNIEKLKDPDYIARYARENYMYSKDGEYIIKMENNDVLDNNDNSSSDYMYLIIVSSLSFIIIILYIIKKRNSNSK